MQDRPSGALVTCETITSTERGLQGREPPILDR